MTQRTEPAATGTPDTPPRAPGRRSGRIASVLLFLAILAITAGGGSLYYLYWNYTRPGPLEQAQDIAIPSGTGTAHIARLFVERGVVVDAGLFVAGARLFGGTAPLRAGEFAFAARISARDAVRVLQSAEPVVRRLTIPEGLTTAEVLALVATTDGLEGETPIAAEGALLPETYHFHYGNSRAEVIARMQVALDRTLADLWARRAPGLPFADAHEALVLASIVEKETALHTERPRVAAVFVNRLRLGMKLQSDPTVAYALTGGTSPLDRALLRADLTLDHPYNTYVVTGLPPGPIANPGRASIAAVLDPANTGDLYFVADGSGGHAFARSLAEHNRNVARWRKLQYRNRAATPD